MKSSPPRSNERGRLNLLTFSRFVPAPENHAALTAVQAVAASFGSRSVAGSVNPLFLHGSAGTGKTHLVWALIHEATRHAPELIASVLSAADLRPAEDGPLPAARDNDLVVIEDLQHLPASAVEPLVQLFDALTVRQQQLLFTSSVGPRGLPWLPARLTSRLASGLVVMIEPLSAAGRLAFLCDQAQRRQLAVAHEVLMWLARHLVGGRQLQGALTRLEALVKATSRPLDVATVAKHFAQDADATRPTLDRIARQVSSHFQVEARQLQSQRRAHHVLLPRQVSMYLARKLTDLSLDEIGTYFGGRDHSTVLHACRKVEQAVNRDILLHGTVRQLRADLT